MLSENFIVTPIQTTRVQNMALAIRLASVEPTHLIATIIITTMGDEAVVKAEAMLEGMDNTDVADEDDKIISMEEEAMVLDMQNNKAVLVGSSSNNNIIICIITRQWGKALQIKTILW